MTPGSAAGSGTTPVLSIAGSVLAAHPGSAVTLLYGNWRSDSVMFTEEIADLQDAYPARLCLVHVLSREPPGWNCSTAGSTRQAALPAAGYVAVPAVTAGGCVADFDDRLKLLPGVSQVCTTHGSG